MRAAKLVFLILLLFTAVPVMAQKNWPLSVPKRSTVILKIANVDTKFSKASVWSGRNSYTAVVERDAEGKLAVNGRSDWNDVGWPLMSNLTIEDTEILKPKDKDPFAGVQVMMKSPVFAYNIILRFGTSVKNIAEAFDELTFKGDLGAFEGSDYYHKEVKERFLPKLFTGRSANLSEGLKLHLLRTCNYENKCFADETYKEQDYLVVRGKLTDYTLNSLKLSPMQRVAWAFNERLLASLKMLQGELDKGTSGHHGLKIEYVIPFRNLADNTGEGVDNVTIYASSANIKLFKDFEITGQELVDRSTVILGQNRIKVDLNLQY